MQFKDKNRAKKSGAIWEKIKGKELDLTDAQSFSDTKYLVTFIICADAVTKETSYKRRERHGGLELLLEQDSSVLVIYS